jgi:hypothetical protein
MLVLASRLRHHQVRAGKLSRRGPTPPEILSWLKIAHWYLEPKSGRHGKPAVGQRPHILLGRSSLPSSLLRAQRYLALWEATCSQLQWKAQLARAPIDDPGARRGPRNLVAPASNRFPSLLSLVPAVLICCPPEAPIRRSRRDLIYEPWPFWPEAILWKRRTERPDRARHRRAVAVAAPSRSALQSPRRVGALAAA